MENLKPLVLAFVGDAVHTLFVREYYSKMGDYKVNELNRMVKEKVNALYQSKVMLAIENTLFEDEKDIARKARNTAKGHKAKNYSVSEYNLATSFEALVGYLYVNKRYDRLKEILTLSLKEGVC